MGRRRTLDFLLLQSDLPSGKYGVLPKEYRKPIYDYVDRLMRRAEHVSRGQALGETARVV